jgi:hypothetical protein
MSVSISRYIPLYATVGTLTLGFGAAIAQTPAQDPFPIPDTTNATCVILDMKQKKQVGSSLGDQTALDQTSLWKGGRAVCDSSGSWIMTWPHQDAPRSGCLVVGAGGVDWFGPGTGVVWSAASSAQCRSDGRWELVRGWRPRAAEP